MPEEPKKQPAATPAVVAEAAPKEDFEAKYKELQAEQGKVVEQLKSAQGTLDILDQSGAIDWQKISGTPESKPESEDPSVAISQRLQRQEGRLLTLQFRLDNPDLKEYEDDLVVPFVLKAKQQNPRKSQEDILKIASESCRGFLNKHETAILAKQKEIQVKKDADKASGLESGGSPAPEDSLDNETARTNYVNMRRQRRAKQIGMT